MKRGARPLPAPPYMSIRLTYEAALRSRCPCVHVAAPVDVVVYLCRAAYHSAEEEGGERGALHFPVGHLTGVEGVPDDLQEDDGDYRGDVDAGELDVLDIAERLLVGLGLGVAPGVPVRDGFENDAVLLA